MPWLRVGLVCLMAWSCGEDNAPYFESVLPLVDTYDAVGPYELDAYVVAPLVVDRVTLRLASSPANGEFADLNMELIDGDGRQGQWRAEIPGRPADSALDYYLVVVDVEGQAAVFPQGAPDELLTFRVLEP